MVFPVVMYRGESWTINKAECQRTDAFELWCWRRLENPYDSKEVKTVNPKVKTLDNPCDSKEVKTVNPKGNQS